MAVAIACIVLIWLLGVSLARYNLRTLRETKQERLEERRKFKKIKNERLRRFYGLPKPPEST